MTQQIADNPKNNFAVQAGTFEGPFDALLAMIEKKKLHISEVSLASIADDYISYVRENEFVLRDATMFVWTAATLMLIKSRHLLPQFQLTSEEEEDTSGLELRLRIYAVYKNQMEKIEKRFGKKRIHSRIFRKKVIITFRPDHRITPKDMRAQIEDVFNTVEPVTFVPEKQVARSRSLKEVIDDIASRVQRFVRVNFHELVVGGDKKEQAVSFLAILELFKQGQVNLEQSEQFQTITVSKMSGMQGE